MVKISLIDCVATVSDEDADLASLNWCASHRGNGRVYVVSRRKLSKNKWTSVYLHRLVAERLGISSSVDHRDRNGLNCTRENLRSATAANNSANRGKPINNTSGFKGVSWQPGRKRWRVSLEKLGITKYIGSSKNLIEAAKMYDLAAHEAFGEFASLNFP